MFRNTTVLFAIVVGVLVVALFTLKHQVRALEEQLTHVNREIGDEQQSIHVLKAEWSHLNDPVRLKELAKRHLDLGPVDLARMQRLSKVAEKGIVFEPPAPPPAANGKKATAAANSAATAPASAAFKGSAR